MTDACQYLHDALSRLPRLRREDLAQVPDNGIYVLFEKGEKGHDVDRIVCIGTHKRQNNLAPRIREHLEAPNKDRSILRKHVGRCLLVKECDPFLTQWELDLTTKASREMNGDKIDEARLKEVEIEVTRYMTEHFSLSVLRCDIKAERLHCKKSLLSTIYQCSRCRPSETWLGKFHPSEKVKDGGLWNTQGLVGPELLLDEAQRLFELGSQA